MDNSEKKQKTLPQDSVPFSDDESIKIPEYLPILPLTGFVVFPGAVGPMVVKSEDYVRMVNEAAAKDRLLGVVLSRSKTPDTPNEADLCKTGTAARILKLMNIATGELSFLCQGVSRIQIDRYIQKEPHFVAEVTQLEDKVETSEELDAMINTLRNQFVHLVDISPQIAEQLKLVAMNLKDHFKLIDFAVGNSTSDIDKQQEILEETDIKQRLRKAMAIVQSEIQKTELSNKIQSEIERLLDAF